MTYDSTGSFIEDLARGCHGDDFVGGTVGRPSRPLHQRLHKFNMAAQWEIDWVYNGKLNAYVFLARYCWYIYIYMIEGS